MDGPLVCGPCDSGFLVEHGVVRKWTEAEYHARAKRFAATVAAIEVASEDRTESTGP